MCLAVIARSAKISIQPSASPDRKKGNRSILFSANLIGC